MTTTEPTFGQLEPVELRTAWEREDSHFTPWLAEKDNLHLLGRTVGLDLELQAQEQSVGLFRADLLCKDTSDGSFVLIENQIERTDHTHLGQVITYAAGLDAVTVVWIAKRFTEEHRAALDWLNEVSHENIRFFGLEVELWRIGESPVAPKFNVVAKPNNWSKRVREVATGGASTGHQSFRQEFWAGFLNHLEVEGSSLSRNRTPSRDHWMNWGVGKTGFHLAGVVGFRDGYIMAELVVDCADGPGPFESLRRDDERIRQELGCAISWDYSDDRRHNYARVRREGVDPMDRNQWPDLFSWLKEKLEALDRAFRGARRSDRGADLVSRIGRCLHQPAGLAATEVVEELGRGIDAG